MFTHAGNTIRQTISFKKLQKQQFFDSVIIGDLDELKKILKYGFDPNTLDHDFSSALHITAEKGDTSVAIVLLRHKEIDINSHENTRTGDTPLITAVTYGRPQFVSLLLLHGADPNIRNHFEKTALHVAVKKRSLSMVRELLFTRAEPNVEDSFGNTPLSFSIIEFPSKKIAETLLEWGADPDYHIIRPQPLLIELALNCCSPEHLDLVRILVTNNGNINIQDRVSKQTPLHMVSITGYCPLASLLLKLGADSNVKDSSGRTPLDVAVDHKHEDLVQLYTEREKLLNTFNKDRLGKKKEGHYSKNVRFNNVQNVEISTETSEEDEFNVMIL
ncbi:hypothetical protein ABEB36_001278 [Hypothenemus hampei]|uniref:Uncharacterized protein n=1 Tax=Hypothenemus hampei TaxID=57062 RepID=A0ABD1FE38_HYPHA